MSIDVDIHSTVSIEDKQPPQISLSCSDGEPLIAIGNPARKLRLNKLKNLRI